MKIRKTSLFLWLLTVEGAAALAVYFSVRSEAQNARVLGFSYERLGVAAAALVVVLALAGLALWTQRHAETADQPLARLDGWFSPERLWASVGGLALLGLFWVGAFFFTFLFLPTHLRPLLLWLAAAAFQGVGFLVVAFPDAFRRYPLGSLRAHLPAWKKLSKTQQRTALVLLALSVAYFLLFIPTNLVNSKDPHTFKMQGGDEYITYPYVVRMLTPGQTLAQTMYYVFIYEDYHYGYPFYVASALVMLPARLVLGNGFADATLVNLLLLRQFINIVPILLSTVLVIWMWTRFESTLYAVGIFLLTGFASAVTGYNAFFWHPDALVVLACVLTLFFLQRDRFRCGWNFALAAVFCGLASAIKMYGVFFFLAIAAYLLAGLATHRLTLKKAVLAGLLFVVVMSATFVLSNPFLFLSSARDRYIHILREKNGDFARGFNYDPDGIYRTGWGPWLPFLEVGFGNQAFLAFLVVSLVAGCLWGRAKAVHRLTLAWLIPICGYLVYFVAVKVTHYWLPAMLPLYGSTFTLAALAEERDRQAPAWTWKALHWAGVLFPAVIIVLFILRFRIILPW
jgi:hypothetical protein